MIWYVQVDVSKSLYVREVLFDIRGSKTPAAEESIIKAQRQAGIASFCCRSDKYWKITF